MKTILICAFMICFGLPGPCKAQDLPSVDPYQIGSGDILDISVWKDPALTKQVIVLPDGKIHFPLVGEMTAQGKTVSQLKSALEERLIKYMPDPVLSISVAQIGSMLIYVIGKVNKPGHFMLNGRVTVLQALAMAGGLNPFAKEKKIRIYREQGGKTLQFPFNFEEVADGENLKQNIVLKRGDVIVVP